jgi:hypothetical protein
MEVKMERIPSILNRCSKQGEDARNKSPEVQKKTEEILREELSATSERDENTLRARGNFLQKKEEETGKNISQVSQGLPVSTHVLSLWMGSIFLLFGLLLIAGESVLINWTMKPFGFEREGIIIAVCLTLALSLASEQYLSHIKKVNPVAYHKYALWLITVSLSLLLVTGFVLANIRGHFLETQMQMNSELVSTVQGAENFYKRATALPLLMGILSVAVGLVVGILIHANLSRVIISAKSVWLNWKLERIKVKKQRVIEDVLGRRNLVNLGICEYQKGLVKNERIRKKLDLHHPAIIIILTLLLIFLLSVSLRAEERESVIVMLDTSRSSLCKGNSGEKDFEKNLEIVVEIIKKLKPGTHFRILLITEKSFDSSAIVLDRTLPRIKGYFGQVLDRSKLELIRSFENLDIKADAQGTDIFGALNLASMLFQDETGAKTLVLISDMKNTAKVNLEKMAYIRESVHEKVSLFIPNLSGVQIYVASVSTCGKDHEYWLSLRRFWEKFFESSGGEVVLFTMERRIDFK